jgi:PAS domain S-box-containing protein
MADKDKNGVVVICLHAAVHKEMRAGLRAGERPFSDVMDHIAMASFVLDAKGRVLDCNEYLLGLTGRQREEVVGGDWFELGVSNEPGGGRDDFTAALGRLFNAWQCECEILTLSGEHHQLRWNNTTLLSDTGTVMGVVCIGEDITAQKQGEIRIAQLKRVSSVLSGINALILRAHDRDELYGEACRIAVEEGGFRMSMICIVDRSTMMIVPVASAGKDDELQAAIKDILLSPEGSPNTMVSQGRSGERRRLFPTTRRATPGCCLGRSMPTPGFARWQSCR